MEHLWTFAKIILYFLAAYILWLLYIAVGKPFMFWYKFRKYENVYTHKWFIPIFGDLYYHLKDMQDGKAHYRHKIVQADEVNKHDLKVRIEGINCVIQVISNKALEQFVAYQPVEIDNITEYRGITKAVPVGFINQTTTKKTFERRKLFTSLLNMNKASCYVNHWIARCEEAFQSMDQEEPQQMCIRLNNIIFNMFITILYGANQMELIEQKRPYKNPDNTTEDVNFCEFLIRVTNSMVLQNFNPITTMFPLISE
jgi:hypothetical protein